MVRVKFVWLEWGVPVEYITEPLPVIKVTSNGVEIDGIGMLASFKHYSPRLLKLSSKTLNFKDLIGNDAIIACDDDFDVGNVKSVLLGGIKIIKEHGVAGNGVIYVKPKNDVCFDRVPVEVVDDERNISISIKLPSDLEAIEEEVKYVDDADKINDIMRFMRKFMDVVFNV